MFYIYVCCVLGWGWCLGGTRSLTHTSTGSSPATNWLNILCHKSQSGITLLRVAIRKSSWCEFSRALSCDGRGIAKAWISICDLCVRKKGEFPVPIGPAKTLWKENKELWSSVELKWEVSSREDFWVYIYIMWCGVFFCCFCLFSFLF